MTSKLLHIVRVHAVNDDIPNIHITLMEKDFETKEDAKLWLKTYNKLPYFGRAVYVGMVNTETGELG